MEVQGNRHIQNPLLITKNKTDSKARKEAQGSFDFKQDSQLSAAEKKILQKEFGMNPEQMKWWSEQSGGTDFLDKLIHAGDGLTDKKQIQAKRKEVAAEFFLKGKTEVPNKFVMEQLKNFGVSENDVKTRIDSNIAEQTAAKQAQEKLDAERPVTRMTTGSVQAGDAVQKDIRMEQLKGEDGKLKELRLYDKNATLEDEPTSILTPTENGLFVDAKSGKYFKLDSKAGLQEVEAPKPQVVEQPQEEPVEETPAAPDFREVLSKAGKKVTIDETGSNQRLTKNNQWSTGVVIPKNAQYNENGIPSKIAIQLPSDYGSVGADGKTQVRYQTLKLVDAENNIYSDSAGVRKFQLEVSEDGITLKHVEINDDKVKTFLDENTRIAAEQAKSDGLTADQKKMEIKDKAASDSIMNKLADRNQSWETYLQVGSDNGYFTGSQGLLEKLVDEHDITGLKTYNDLKPAIDGLIARISDDPAIKNSPEYKNLEKILNELAAKPNEELDHNWASQLFRFGDTPIRALDKALMELGQKHIAGRVQGTNYANNSFLVGGNSKVVIQPESSSSGFKTDAKFTINGQDYNFRKKQWIMDNVKDFQDIVGHNDSLITNDVTGNNRKGEIKFHAEKLNPKPDGSTGYVFRGPDGNDRPVTVTNGIAYVSSADGSKKVPVEDVLNGRADMP